MQVNQSRDNMPEFIGLFVMAVALPGRPEAVQTAAPLDAEQAILCRVLRRRTTTAFRQAMLWIPLIHAGSPCDALH
jgi:hypothetical protein